jgi:Bacterial Ig domain/Domain of unknown function (DUF5979)
MTRTMIRTIRSIARHTSPYALLAILLATALAAPARAQVGSPGFPTPAKSLCTGMPDVNNPTACTATFTPAPYVSVFYTVTLQPFSTVPQTVGLLETLPPGFVRVGASWKVVGTTGPATTFTSVTLVSTVTRLGWITLHAPQTVVCFIWGYFTNPPSQASVINHVKVADESWQPVSSEVTHNAIVTWSAPFPSDLAVTKTVTPTSVDVSLGPQTLTYTVVMTNNGPVDVYIGPIAELFDKVRTPLNVVPIQVKVVPNSTTCTSLPPGVNDCLNLIPVNNYPPTWTTAITTPTSFVSWRFPTGSAGYIKAGTAIQLTYQVDVRRHLQLFCARGGEALKNEVFFGLTLVDNTTVPPTSTTITEANPANNTASSQDVAVSTGQQIDPDCGLPDDSGPIKLVKTQISPLPNTAIVPWNTPVTYRITMTNTDQNPIVVRLRDRVMEWPGTPPFDVIGVTAVCTPVCTPPGLTPPASLSGYFAQATAWDKTNLTVPGAVSGTPGSVQVDITLTYKPMSCDSFAAGDDEIRNIARAEYTFNSTNYMTEAYFQTIMASQPACNLIVKKQVLDTDSVVFGVPLTDPSALTYHLSYQNAGTTQVTIGTLIDAVRIQESNYAASLPFTYSYTCTPSGTLTGTVPGWPIAATGSGSIVYTTLPSQGTRIIQSGPMVFWPGATLTCDVKVSISRPASGDPNCLSGQQPRLENLALMDVSRFYDPNLQWPPSGTYSPTTPVATSQPTSLTNWSAVSVKLPKCYRLVVNKEVHPGMTWAPGGVIPSPTYTITVLNAGDTLTGSGLVIGDEFTGSYASLVVPMTQTSTCGATFGTWSVGTPSVLPVNVFPANCSIYLTFTLTAALTPPPPDKICNRAFAKFVPANSTDWYANTPDPLLLESSLCLPVLATNDLTISKIFNNNAGVQFPNGILFPAIVSCNTPAGTTMTSAVNLNASAAQVMTNVPVGSNCWVSEQWSTLPVEGTGKCKPPSVPLWQAAVPSPGSVVIAARPAQNLISVTNELDCVTPPVNTLTVSKTFAPPSLVNQVPLGAVFPTQVVCPPYTNTVANLTSPNYQQDFTNIPVGTPCTITELDPLGTDIPKWCTWSQTYPNGQRLTIPERGTPTLVVQNALLCNGHPDLAVTKSGPTLVPGTNYYSFTITVTSLGGPFSIPSGGLIVTDVGTGMFGSLFGMSVVPSASWSAPVTTSTTGSSTYLGPGPTAVGQVLGTFTIYYVERMLSSYTNCATATLVPVVANGSAAIATQEDNLQNNTACVPGGPKFPSIDLAIRKTGPVAVPGSPGLSRYVLQVTNAGAAFTMPAYGMKVTDVTSGMSGSFVNISETPSSAWNCSVSGGTASCQYIGSTPPNSAIPAGPNYLLGTITLTWNRSFMGADSITSSNCATVALTNISPLVDANPANDKSCVGRSFVNPRRRVSSTGPAEPNGSGFGGGSTWVPLSADHSPLLEDHGGNPPDVHVTSPREGDVLIEGDSVRLAADATDDIAVASVVFTANHQVVRVSTTAPYEYTMSVPSGVSKLTIGAIAADLATNTRSAAPVTVAVIRDPLTRVTGSVVDANGVPIAAATVSTIDGATAQTRRDGTFVIAGVPTINGPTVVSARFIARDATLLTGSSQPFAALRGGTTAVGAIVAVSAVWETDFGTLVTSCDDCNFQRKLPFTFPFYGHAWTTAFVGSNGYITFGRGDNTRVVETLAAFNALPRISAFFDHLIVGNGIWVNDQLPGRFVITYSNMSHSIDGGSSTLQITLFSDGRIQFAYRGIGALASERITGLTPGPNAPPQEIDFSATPSLEVPDRTAVFEYFTTADPFDLDGAFVVFTPRSGGGYGVRTILPPSSGGRRAF